jgi:hypothetical protein
MGIARVPLATRKKPGHAGMRVPGFSTLTHGRGPEGLLAEGLSHFQPLREKTAKPALGSDQRGQTVLKTNKKKPGAGEAGLLSTELTRRL